MRLVLFTVMALTAAGLNVFAADGSPPAPADAEVYQFFDRCAERGLLPANISTLQPLSYADIARTLIRLSDDYGLLKDCILTADLDYYLSEYAAEVKDIWQDERCLRSVGWSPGPALENPHWRLYTHQNKDGYIVFDPLATVRVDRGDKTIMRRGSGLQFHGRLHFLGGNFQFVDNTERGNGPYIHREQLLEDRYGYVGPLQGGNETYYDFNEAHISLQIAKFKLIFGKGRVDWGPGHFSNLLISTNATTFDRLQIIADIGSRFRYSYLTGKLKDWGFPADTLYRTPDGWTRLAASQKWLAAHRMEFTPRPWLTLAVSEAVVWGERGMDFAYLNPLAFLYSAQHAGDDQDNVLMSGDFRIIYPQRGVFYGALLIDDMKTSAIGTSDVANKIGYLGGASSSHLGLAGGEAGIEYMRLDPFVYSHTFPVNRYTHWRANLGADLKPNSDRLTLWGQYRPHRSWTLDFALSRNRHSSLGGSPDDFRPADFDEFDAAFLNGTRTNWTSSELALKWEFFPGGALQIGWIKNEQNSIDPDRAYFNVSYRI